MRAFLSTTFCNSITVCHQIQCVYFCSAGSISFVLISLPRLFCNPTSTTDGKAAMPTPASPTAGGSSSKGITTLSRTSSIGNTSGASLLASPAAGDNDDVVDLNSSAPRITVLYEMLVLVVRDPAEFRSILALLRHFLEQTLACQKIFQESVLPNVAASEISTQTESGLAGAKVSSSSSSSVASSKVSGGLEPMVLISDQSRVTRMVCPTLSVIGTHSAALHSLLKVGMYMLYFTVHVHLFGYLSNAHTGAFNF